MLNRAKPLAVATLAFCLGAPLPGYSQEQSPPDEQSSGGWRRADEPRREEESTPSSRPAFSPAPLQLVLPAGTWITVRVDEELSSDHNLSGDAFSATLAHPLVANGFVVARRGQTIEGRVAEVQKAGRVKGTSTLGLELTEISLVDGQQLPVRTRLIRYSGGTSYGRDATAIGAATGVGAAVGAAAGGGFGAGVGAAAGAAASTIGVLVTRGRATVVYPEASLTFRVLQPLTISTERSEQAFWPVRQEDYEPRLQQRRASRPPGLYARPGYYGGFYDPYYSPFFYGPRFHYFSGPRFYGRRGFSHRR